MEAPHPDPSHGIFETLLVVDGAPIELDAHLRRLHASARTLFGDATAARLRGPARAAALARTAETAARGTGAPAADAPAVDDPAAEAATDQPATLPDPAPLARLRLTVAPTDAGAIDVSARTAAVDPNLVFPDHGSGPSLAPATVAGGLGAHKWADRWLLERAASEVSPALPLLVDAEGSVLEADRANVFAVVDDAIVTPPTDGRILPGVSRAAVLALARELGIDAVEREISLDELRAADAAFLTGSVRGIEPVRAVGNRPLPAPAMVEDLAAALHERWLGSV